MRRTLAILLIITALPVWAKVDLVTLPKRDTVQLTIYNSADLTLVRETRQLTLPHGGLRSCSLPARQYMPRSMRGMLTAVFDKFSVS